MKKVTNYTMRIPAAQRQGIYTKINPMSVIAPGFAQFNFNPAATPVAGVFTNVYLPASQYSITKYGWSICCASGQRIANTQTSNNIVEANNNNTLLVYPNPNSANSLFNIDINANEQGNIIITDILGKVIYTKLINSGITNITTTKAELNISVGVYIVTLQLNSKTLTQKLIIN